MTEANRNRQANSLRALIFAGFLAAAALLTARQADAEPLSEVVATGIGQRFAAVRGPVSYDRWPTPLGDSPGAMMTVAITPGGSLVATGCGHPNQAGELVLWDAATGRERWCRSYPRGIRSIAFTTDGSRLVAGSYDGVARLITAADGKLLQEFRGHRDGINSVAISTDDRWLATGSLDQAVILWNLADGSQLRTFRGHTDDVLTVAISSSGKLLTSAGRRSARSADARSSRASTTSGGRTFSR
jgi:WD40 repeat protein